jgi:hypothetical protein
MTQRSCTAKPKIVKLPTPASQPMVDSYEKFRFFQFLRRGFQAPDDSTKTRFSTYNVLLNPGVGEERLFDFLKQELGMAHFPTLMGEFDGHITLRLFKAAELEGLVVLETRVSGARVEPLEERYRGSNFE